MLIKSALITTPHGFFTRDENAEAIKKSLNAKKLITAKQIHSNIALHITGEGNFEGDALITNKPGIAVAVNTADCGPILMHDANAGVIAAVHAGWKGARFGIIESSVKLMKEKGAKNIRSSIGPCIHKKSYEVSNEFFQNFLQESQGNKIFFSDSVKSGHFMFNLPGYIENKLKQSGINEIEISQEDTLSQPEKFCSFRRSTLAGEKDAGRQLSAICLA